MKKLGLFVCAIAAMAMCFTSCEKKQKTDNNGTDVIDITDQVADGMYVIGEAVGVTDFSKAADLLMATGVNEKLMDAQGMSWTDAHRAGMYEKYLYLEGGKDFTLTLLDGDKKTNYGGTLVAKTLKYDAGDAKGYWCALEQNKAMQVPQTGFYHVVLDLNLDGGLDAADGAQIIVAPVSWGISGEINSWGMTLGTKDGDTWTWENVEFQAGQKFKFKDEKGWKIWLDGETQQISAHTNLGANLQNGGSDIVVEVPGLYTITLTYKLAKGDIADSYTYGIKKTGEAAELNPAEFVVGLSGIGGNWGDPSGASLAKYNATESNIEDAATKKGTYVYNITGLTFADGTQFKFRMNGAWLGLGDIEATGVTLSEADGNITGVNGTYDIKMTMVWDGEKMTSFKAEFTEGTPSEIVYADITVTGIVPEGWTKCFIWAWYATDNTNYTGGKWPGEELTIEDGKVTKSFTNVATPLNVIFSNGEGAQTKDIEDVKDGTEIDIQANLQ